MLRGRKYLRESLERGWCPSGGGGSGPGRAEGHLVHMAEEHHRTRSGGGGDFPKHSCVLIVSCAGSGQSLGRCKGEWSKPGVIRGVSKWIE